MMMSTVVLLALLALCGVLSAQAHTVNKITQADFDKGTFFISEPGHYLLDEDIEFKPTAVPVPDLTTEEPELWLYPDITTAPYNTSAFHLGFFAALIIECDGVTLDLGGHTIQQSPEHSATMRFFAVIELTNSPFPPNAGPSHFGGVSEYKAASNVKIMNGKIGRSSHHGVHGNNNINVVLQDLEFTDFEVGGISLNAVNGLELTNVHVHDQRQDVPASVHLSNAIFLLQIIHNSIVPDKGGEMMNFSTMLESKVSALRADLWEALDQIQNGISVSNDLFNNPNGLPDASMVFGVLLHPNLNVGWFLMEPPANYSNQISMTNLRINNLVNAPHEIGALFMTNVNCSLTQTGTSYLSPSHVHDPVGAVLDIDFAHHPENMTYKANSLADCQLALATYFHECKARNCTSNQNPAEYAIMKRNTICPNVVKWSKGLITWDTIKTMYKVQGNHDIMFHTAKGPVGLKMDGCSNVDIVNVTIDSVENICGSKCRSPLALACDPNYIYTGYFSRALAVSSSLHVDVELITISNIESFMDMDVCVDAKGENQGVTTCPDLHSLSTSAGTQSVGTE